MFDYKNKVSRVLLELSNLCHYATEHKKCPLHLEETPNILSQKIILHVIDTLGSWPYKGNVSFHAYNEPGIDPRLFMLIAHTRKKCPDATISIMSNGYYLDENLLNEYKEIGVNEIFLSAYSEKDYLRFSSYQSDLKVVIQRPKLDDRLALYEREELASDKPCHAPYSELMITREGYVGLCCFDWRRQVVFGDLNSEGLEEILTNKQMITAYEDLIHGKRVFNVCRRCDWSR